MTLLANSEQMKMVWCICSGKCSVVAQHNDGLLQSGFISHAYQNGNNSNLKCSNISWFAITFQMNKKKEKEKTHTDTKTQPLIFYPCFYSLLVLVLILVLARCTNDCVFLLLIFILSLSLSIYFSFVAAPISYFVFHVHHVAVDIVLFSFATFVPFHIQSFYFMFGLLIQSLDALCSKLLSL